MRTHIYPSSAVVTLPSSFPFQSRNPFALVPHGTVLDIGRWIVWFHPSTFGERFPKTAKIPPLVVDIFVSQKRDNRFGGFRGVIERNTPKREISQKTRDDTIRK